MQYNKIKEQILDLNYYDDTPINIGGYEIDIHYDDWAESPREWDSPFTMVCGHSRYNLGDEQWSPEYAGEYAMYEYFHGMSGLMEDKGYYNDFTDDDLRRLGEWTDQNVLWLPLYLYDHSGITMRTTSFSCRWDSGMVGFIYITREDARKYWKWDRISSKREKDVYKWMKGEVKTYDMYLRGDVYGYTIEYEDEIIDSCSGFYGDSHDDKYMLEQIASHIEYHYNERKKDRFEKVKAFIRNNVPLTKRPQLIPTL